MINILRRYISIFLVVVLVLNMIPLNVFATEQKESENAAGPVQNTENDLADVYVLEEIVEHRSEFTKKFRLSNGLFLAAVYPSAVHYEVDGHWEEIDNTLKMASARSGNVYTNTAGAWQVLLPENLSADNGVTISRDGYDLNFRMAGALTFSENDLEIMGIEVAKENAIADEDTLSTIESEVEINASILHEGITVSETEIVQMIANAEIVSAKDSAAEVIPIDLAAQKESAQFEEIVPNKLASRLEYSDVYQNTNVVFDLDSNLVKESIVIEQYDSDLHGYRYVLNTGAMIPVLTEENDILLYDESGAEVIMLMPAPYLIDTAGEISCDIKVVLQDNGSNYILSYLLPTNWMSMEERQWPVILDPVVQTIASNSNAEDQTVYQNSNIYTPHTSVVITAGYDSSCRAMRTYLRYTDIPDLTAADVIIHANLNLYMPEKAGSAIPIELHRVTSQWSAGDIRWSSQPSFDTKIEDYALCDRAQNRYSWDITDLVRSWYYEENYGMVLKASDAVENAGVNNWKRFYSANFTTAEQPIVTILFRSNIGLESYWDYTTSSAGRAGTGYVNKYTGNLVWVRNDIGFGGNRMPVAISHVYNANDSTENLFGMGFGWRTNFNQRVYQWDEDDAYGDYYVWEDADGTDHYFLKFDNNIYKDEDGLELTLTTHGSGSSKYYLITDKYGNTSKFDSKGRLVKQENNQATKSSINITYTTTDGYLISTITDGANRRYSFSYFTNNLLSRISYYGTGNTEISYTGYGYNTSKQLNAVEDKGYQAISYTYAENNLLTSAQDIDGYKISYAYTTTEQKKPNRINTITEYSGTTAGGVLNIEYAHNQTKFTDHSGNVQILQFNNMGNTISIQDDQGRAQYAQYAINDPANPDDTATADAATGTSGTAKGNQLRLASKLQNTVGNILSDSSFENSTLWTASSSAVTHAIDSSNAYMGSKSLRMDRTNAGTEAGVYSDEFSVASGETYTFSAYVKTGTGDAYLALDDGGTVVTSETLGVTDDWTRLEVSYTNISSAVKNVKAKLMSSSAGTVYMDCVQVEKAPTASRYNLIQNGDFTLADSWSSTSGNTTVSAAGIEKVPASQLDSNIYKMTGNPQGTNRISQTVNVSGVSGDTFVLAGWAKADSVPIRDNREFALIATFKNGDAIVNKSTVRFNPCADSTINWQYAASPVIAGGAYTSIVVEIAYDYNANTAYFDGIQLYKEMFGNSYTYDGNGNIISVKDLQSKTTTYEYTNNDLTKERLPSGAVLTYEYDAYHNVTKATSSTGVVYEFTYDAYGNNESVSVTDGTKKITSSADYSDDGKLLLSTTDAAGNITHYVYDVDTNVLKSVQYPEDTLDTITKYEYYENTYLLKSVSAKVRGETESLAESSAIYEYQNDLLSKITTGSTEYGFSYTDFALRSQIKIGNRSLASYIYKDINDSASIYADSKFNDAPIHSLIGLDYGNGDKVQYTYDKQGKITSQTYEDGDTVTYKYDNSGALAAVTDSATGITTKYYYDFIDRLLKYTEESSTLSHTVAYIYNAKNQLTEHNETINGEFRRTGFQYDNDNRLTYSYNALSQRAYTYDEFGRAEQRIIRYQSTPLLTDTYEYVVTDNGETSQVHKILRDGVDSDADVTYTYTYDKNGNIASVSDGTNKTEYAYDTANQLVQEKNQAEGKIWEWEYDNAGNITCRREYNYSTGALIDTVQYGYDETWGDLLKSYDGQNITYDEIGNPTSYYNGTRWTMTWEHGRELATISNGSTTWTNTYDADGLRTKRTNGTTTYTYVYDGGRLTQVVKNGTNMRISYDANGPISLKYQNATYQYVTNLQGDVVALLDTAGNVVVEYVYDAWGNILDINDTTNFSLGTSNPLRYRGYVYDTETQLYYLQSRYYDPKVGRFLNADALVSTGLGLLGNNMFAYCLNNPIYSADYSGKSTIAKIAPAYADFDAFSAGSGAASGDLLIGSLVGLTAIAVSYAVSEIYTFANTFVDSLVSKYADHQPRVHHVIPVGKFQRYGPDVVQMMDDMHELLASVGISINDPENLLIISHGTHKSMHTRMYITVIHRIMMCARGGNEFDVRLALLFARMYAASLDQYPYGW